MGTVLYMDRPMSDNDRPRHDKDIEAIM